MNYYAEAIRNYGQFNGRATRSEYWWFFLINFVVVIALSSIKPVVGGNIIKTISGLYTLFIFLPHIAVTVRRLHDSDRSGWWFLLSVIPVIGTVILAILLCFRSTNGVNRFGSARA